MPHNDGEVRVEITGDSSKIKQELKETESAVKNTANAASEMVDALESTVSSSGGLNNIAGSADSAAKSISKAANETDDLGDSMKNEAEAAEKAGNAHGKSLNPKIKQTGEEAKNSSGKVASFSDALNNMAKKVVTAKAAIGAAETIVNAITSITKSAVGNFSEYEQLVGGVETLFKDSADVVQEYAANAYDSAGISANEYMQTVTSFSASLLQSLGGDTDAATKVANKAITDMADNANKMGTDMQSIRNAYQGFAKANYTMLDNLKLGYGGTKEEMQRLLEDAEKFSGIKYDISSYADVVEAIHVIQGELEISGRTAEEAAEIQKRTGREVLEQLGTTAKEASTTIQGSLSSARAAWQNLLTGIADENADFDTLISNFAESAATAVDNLLPRVKTALEGIGELVTELSPVIAEAIPELVDDVLPSIVQAAVDLVTALVNALVNNGATISDTALDMLDMLVNALVDNADNITNGAVVIITELVNGISERLPDLIPAALQIVLEVVKGILDNSGALISAALQLIVSLGAGLLEALPQLVEAVVMIPTSIADSIVNYDWGSVAENVINSLANSFDKLGKQFQVWLDNTFSGGTVYGGDIANVDSTGLVKGMRDNADLVGDEIRKAQENYQRYYNEGKEILGMGQQDISDALENSTKSFKEQSEKNSAAINDVINKSNNAAAAAISAGGEEIAEATKKSGEKQKSVLVQTMEALERLYKQREITEEEYQRQRLEYLEAHRDEDSDEWTKYYDSVQTYYEKVAKTEQQAAEKAAKEVQQNVDKSISSIVKHFQKAYDELDKKRENYRKKLLSIGGDIFSFDEIENPDGTKTKQYTVNNIEEQIKAMRQYNADIAKLKKQGASSGLLEELTSLSDGDSQQFAKYLSEMSKEEFDKINEAYAEKQRVADELSKELYADEYEAIADGINTALDEVSAGAADKGKAAAESYAKAFGDTLLKHSEDFSSLLDDETYAKWFENSGDTPNLFAGMSGDMEKLMKMFMGSNFADIAAKVTSTVRSEQARYSAPAYTAAVVNAAPDTASTTDSKRKSDITAILEKLNKPLSVVLDGKVIAETVMTYQNNYMRGTGG